MKEKMKNTQFKPIVMADYIPEVVKRLVEKISLRPHQRIYLLGFGENMRWVYRLLAGNGLSPELTDWRPQFEKYDCGGQDFIPLGAVIDDPDNLLVICADKVGAMKDAMRCLMEKQINRIQVIYDHDESYSPFSQDEPHRSIRRKARKRAISMITDGQLFELVQFIRATRNVDGDVVEFGSLYGGSGAVIVEAVAHYGDRPVYLFDSFKGIPPSRYGLDCHWNGSFTDNSYASVCDAFADCDQVTVVQGNILETHQELEGPISFGYIASDTLESGEVLLNFLWPKLSPGGIVAICDYGSYPNSIPLTMYVDKFFEGKTDALIFKPRQSGFYATKQ